MMSPEAQQRVPQKGPETMIVSPLPAPENNGFDCNPKQLKELVEAAAETQYNEERGLSATRIPFGDSTIAAQFESVYRDPRFQQLVDKRVLEIKQMYDVTLHRSPEMQRIIDQQVHASKQHDQGVIARIRRKIGI